MPKLLITVVDAFEVKGRGVVPLPALENVRPFPIQKNDFVELRKPDGTQKSALVVGLEFFHTSPPNPSLGPAMMLNGLRSKDEIPVGTEIWTTD